MATNFKASSEKYVGFFGKHHPFSNFHPCPLTYETNQLDGQGIVTNSKMTLHFNTTEALYQWKKKFSTPTKNNCFPASKTSPPDVRHNDNTSCTLYFIETTRSQLEHLEEFSFATFKLVSTICTLINALYIYALYSI